MAGFTNKYYSARWLESPPGHPEIVYKNGSWFPEEKAGGFAVYDGAGNLMGYIRRNGNFVCPDGPTEYSAGFLRAAKEELTALGEVYGGSHGQGL